MNNQNILKKIQPILIWGISDLYFILAITVTILFGVLVPDIQKQLNLTTPQLGFLGFGFFLSFGVTQLLTGRLIDSLGPRVTLTLLASLAGVGLVLLSRAEFNQAFIAQIITGAGFSVSYVGAIYLASSWFSKKYFSLLSGITQMSSNLIAAILIYLMVLTKSVTMDFRVVMLTLALIAFIMAILLFLIVRKSPNSSSKPVEKSSFREDFYKLFQIPQFWLGAIYFSATLSVFLAFSSLWNVPDSIAYGRDLETATMMSATLRIGGALGAFMSGLLASWLGRYSKIAQLYSTGALFLGALVIYGPVMHVVVVFLLFAMLGFFFGGSALGFPLAGQYIPPELKGTGFGLMAAMGYLLCATLQFLTGFILGTQISPGSLPTIEAFKVALTPLVLTLLVGWLCTLWLKDPHQN